MASGTHIVGRDRELAAIERLLDSGRTRFSALLLDGDAGIGKSTVVREALRVAEARGFRVLACRPGAAEESMSMAAVGDLLDGVPESFFDALPAPQRRALDVSLLRVEAGGRRVERRAVAAGVRTLVAALAAERPVLIAVDDVQWLDPASAAVLGFLVRRLGPERVALLATRRTSEPAGLDLETLVSPDRLERGRLEPLSLGSLQRVLGDHLGAALPRSTTVRVHAAANGNPLYALEIARMLAERGPVSSAEPLPVPDDLRELVRRRVEALPAGTRELLLASALLAQPTLATLRRALGRPIEPELEGVEEAGLARVEGAAVAFVHPLYAAAVVAAGSAAERRRMHQRLAPAVDTLEERARHLGLGADGPDASVADALEEGAAAAWSRGSPEAAADLLERARALTPVDAETGRSRGIRAAELHLRAGDRARARVVLEELAGQRLSPGQRTETLRLLGELAFSEEDLLESERLLTESVASGGDPHQALPALLDLVFVTTGLRMDFARASELGRQALASIGPTEDRGLLAEALAYSALADFLAGRGVDEAAIEQAVALADPDRIAPIGLPADAVAGLVALYSGRHPEARNLLAAVRTRLSERGYEADLAHVLFWLSWLETRCGDFGAAERLAEEAASCTLLADDRSLHRWASAQLAYVEAHRGEVDAARRRAASAVAGEGRGVAQVALWVAATQALAELSLGNAQAAWESCEPLVEMIESAGLPPEPMPFFFLPDALEALIELGELERAEALLDALEARGRELDRVWALATAARCRGLLLAACGDVQDALAAFDAALAEHERIELPFDRARTLLVKGHAARRARRRKLAHDSIAEAAAEFERMGATLWAERARSELERLAGARSSTADTLTPSERRVVELAAQGLSNKEIAKRLVVTVHTVEVHLTHAFPKLGVRSRSQLAARLAAAP